MEFTPTGVDLPNVMTPGAWVIVGIVVAAVLASGAYVLVRFLQARIKWQPFPVAHPLSPMYYGKDHEPDAALLLMAVSTTLSLLVQHTTWRAADIMAALQGLRIYVQPTPSWDDNGRQVAGLSLDGAVMVGSDFAALLHECAHVCEERIDRTVRYDHAGWDAAGIRRAENAFAAWLGLR